MTVPLKSKPDDPFVTYGTSRCCAWSQTDTLTRIQTDDPAIAKELRRLPDCRQVGYSVTRQYLRLFDIPYTLAWVVENVVAKFYAAENTPEFPRKMKGAAGEIGSGATLTIKNNPRQESLPERGLKRQMEVL